MLRTVLLTSLVISALANFGYLAYLRQNAPESVKQLCAHKPIGFFYRNQYTDCLARNGH